MQTLQLTPAAAYSNAATQLTTGGNAVDDARLFRIEYDDADHPSHTLRKATCIHVEATDDGLVLDFWLEPSHEPLMVKPWTMQAYCDHSTFYLRPVFIHAMKNEQIHATPPWWRCYIKATFEVIEETPRDV